MATEGIARKKFNFRKVSEQRTCHNCDNAKGDVSLSEGYDRCIVHQTVLYCAYKRKHVCDAWEKKRPPTVRERALSKLTAEERRALGI